MWIDYSDDATTLYMLKKKSRCVHIFVKRKSEARFDAGIQSQTETNQAKKHVGPYTRGKKKKQKPRCYW